MTSEREWLGDHTDCLKPIRLREQLDAPRYTISQASEHINSLESEIARWVKEYALLAEQVDGLRECKERLRIRSIELEGLRDVQFQELRQLREDLRQAHTQIGQLQSERDQWRAKASYPKAGW
jgi:chromosome segregation ATPase